MSQKAVTDELKKVKNSTTAIYGFNGKQTSPSVQVNGSYVSLIGGDGITLSGDTTGTGGAGIKIDVDKEQHINSILFDDAFVIKTDEGDGEIIFNYDSSNKTIASESNLKLLGGILDVEEIDLERVCTPTGHNMITYSQGRLNIADGNMDVYVNSDTIIDANLTVEGNVTFNNNIDLNSLNVINTLTVNTIIPEKDKFAIVDNDNGYYILKYDGDANNIGTPCIRSDANFNTNGEITAVSYNIGDIIAMDAYEESTLNYNVLRIGQSADRVDIVSDLSVNGNLVTSSLELTDLRIDDVLYVNDIYGKRNNKDELLLNYDPQNDLVCGKLTIGNGLSDVVINGHLVAKNQINVNSNVVADGIVSNYFETRQGEKLLNYDDSTNTLDIIGGIENAAIHGNLSVDKDITADAINLKHASFIPYINVDNYFCIEDGSEGTYIVYYERNTNITDFYGLKVHRSDSSFGEVIVDVELNSAKFYDPEDEDRTKYLSIDSYGVSVNNVGVITYSNDNPGHVDTAYIEIGEEVYNISIGGNRIVVKQGDDSKVICNTDLYLPKGDVHIKGQDSALYTDRISSVDGMLLFRYDPDAQVLELAQDCDYLDTYNIHCNNIEASGDITSPNITALENKLKEATEAIATLQAEIAELKSKLANI